VAAELVFLDGRYSPGLSDPGAPPHGVRACGLDDALHQVPDLVRPHLGRYAAFADDAFTALNTAFLEDGAFVHVARGVAVERPIHVILAASDAGNPGGPRNPGVSHPRNLIVAEAGSRATIIQTCMGPAARTYWTNTVTEAVLGPDAEVHYYLVAQDGAQAFNISTLRIQQHARSRLEAHTALFGGALVRNNVHVELAGDDCQSLINGLFVGRGRQHMDNNMRVVHAALRGDSRQFYKGILDDEAHGVFSGRILVQPGAQKTDAKQTSRNLLLSDDAVIDTRPQLEIYADDVKCTHGATTGRLDDAAAFYLGSRGISPEAVRGLLIYAFARESLNRMAFKPVRARLERYLIESLPQPELLQTLMESDEAT
jgi:Fe-S cluster assembly protein SufD